MKKHPLFCLALAAALLAGCTAAPSFAGTADTASSGRGEAATAPVQTESAPVGLHTLSAGDEDGFYAVGTTADTRLSMVNYVDYATLTAGPLCADPACTHDSDSCTACLPYGRMIYGVRILDKDRILMMAGGEEAWPVLYTAARDGSDRQALYEGSSQAYLSIGNTMLMADDQYIYFCVTEENPQDTALSGGLYRVPVTGGEAQRLFTTTNHTMVGVVDGQILCVVYDLTDGSGAGTRYLRLYATDGSFTDLMTWTDADPARSFGVDGDRILWMDEGGGAGWLKPDGSSGQVAVSWPFTVGTAQDQYLINLDSRMPVLDGKLLVKATSVSTDIVVNRYALDPDTGALTPLSLSYMAGEVEQPIELAAVTGDQVLCTFAMNWEPAGYVTPEGVNVEADRAASRIGLLSLSDFWADAPNYREITCSMPLTL